MNKEMLENTFSGYSDKWFDQLEVLLEEFSNVCTSENEALEALISKMTAHIKEYYAVKWALAQDRSFFFYCPVWTTPLENAYSWMSGFKPSMVFHLVETMRLGTTKGPGLQDLTDHQVNKIESLRLRIRAEEMKVDRELERQQVALADRRVLELARIVARFRPGLPEVGHVDALVDIAMKNVLNGMENLMKAADCVRLKTLKGILDLLNPSQGVRFLTGNANLQLKLRKWGIEREKRLAANRNQLAEASSSASAFASTYST